MTTQQNIKNTVIVDKSEYEALLQIARVTSEHLNGESKKFKSPKDLIANLKKLDDHQ